MSVPTKNPHTDYHAAHRRLEATLIPRLMSAVHDLASNANARVGSKRGAMGQVPFDCSLADCCDYTQNNGQRHLSALAKAMDSNAGKSIDEIIRSSSKLILVDLGSGPGLSWLLFYYALLQRQIISEISVINIDHASQMHHIARTFKHITTLEYPETDDINFRFSKETSLIDSFTTSELDSNTSVLIILNHVVNQTSRTNESVPDFIKNALESASRLAQRANTKKIVGVSIEPRRMRGAFGQDGLLSCLTPYGGVMLGQSEIPGDRAGKSVISFRF